MPKAIFILLIPPILLLASAIIRLLAFCIIRKPKFVVIGPKSYYSCRSWYRANQYIVKNLWGKNYQVFIYERHEYIFIGNYKPPKKYQSQICNGCPTLSGDSKYQ